MTHAERRFIEIEEKILDRIRSTGTDPTGDTRIKVSSFLRRMFARYGTIFAIQIADGDTVLGLAIHRPHEVGNVLGYAQQPRTLALST